jgi:MFS family permease
MKIDDGWKCVLGGFIIHCVLGTLYIWGNITVYVTAYLRRFDPSITYNDTIMIYALQLCGQGSTMFIGGLIDGKMGVKFTCMLGGFIVISSTFCSAFCTSLYSLLFFDGIMFGVGIGICYSAPIASSCRWLPAKKGLVTGTIVAGFGGGSFIYGYISTLLANPNSLNISDSGSTTIGYYNSDNEVIDNVPKMFLYLSLCYLICFTVAILLIGDPPSHQIHSDYASISSPLYQSTHNNNLDQYKIINTNNDKNHDNDNIEFTIIQNNDINSNSPISIIMPSSSLSNDSDIINFNTLTELEEEYENQSPSIDNEICHSNDMDPLQLIKMPIFYHLSLCMTLTSIGGMYIAGTFKTFGEKNFNSEAYLSTMASTSAIFNCLGRILWGFLADHYGIVNTITMVIFFFSFAIGTYSYSPIFGEIGFSIWSYSIFFFEGKIYFYIIFIL